MLGKTELDVNRYTPLARQQAISQQQLDDAVQANLMAKAAVLADKAAVESARLNLGFTRITSPVDGIAGIAQAQIGDLLGPGGPLNGRPAAVMAIYHARLQRPGRVPRGEGSAAEFKQAFPQDLDYAVSLDTTLAVSRGVMEILTTLWEALLLVVVVVYLFLKAGGQHSFRCWRCRSRWWAPLRSSRCSGFPSIRFPCSAWCWPLGWWWMTLSLSLRRSNATSRRAFARGRGVRAMEEVSGPVVAIALILSAVFVPTVFIPGITGRLYQQFALTIAISVIFSAFNALSLSPALAACC